MVNKKSKKKRPEKNTKKNSKSKKMEEEKRISEKKQISSENKVLRNFFFGIAAVIIAILIAWLLVKSSTSFEYKEVPFSVEKTGRLVLYHTKVPVYYKGEKVNYNLYLRNDPRKLEKTVPFYGNFTFKKAVVLNSTSDFGCSGYGAIANTNLKQMYSIAGVEILSPEGAECDSESRYTYIEINAGNETFINQTGEACYEISVKNCEILPALERFMVEGLVKINAMLN